MKRLMEFLKSIFNELKKVTWISSKQVVKLTLTVVSISLAIGMFLQLTDILLQYIIKKYL